MPNLEDEIDYTFGDDFNYDQWNSDTRLTLCNVPWDNAYESAVPFDNRGALNAYIESLPGSLHIDGLSKLRPSEPIRIDIAYERVLGYNYVRASVPANPSIPGSASRDYYYFINDVIYRSGSNTVVLVQLDMFQSFFYDIDFGTAYVERGHAAVANETQFEDYGRRWLTTPEGFDIGNEYQIRSVSTRQLMSPDSSTFGDGPDSSFNTSGYAVLVTSTVDLLSTDWGNEENPRRSTAPGSDFAGLAAGATHYVFDGAVNFKYWLETHKTTPWAASGIISVKLVPDIKRYWPDFEYSDDSNVPALAPSGRPRQLEYSLLNDWRDQLANLIPAQYRKFKKFFTSPYMIMELTTFSAAPAILKPELWNNKDAMITELASLIAPGDRAIFLPRRYNAHDDLPEAARYMNDNDGPRGDDRGEYLNVAALMPSFPSVAIVNDGAISYMASNAHSIAQGFAQSDWSQQRSLASNQLSFDQANQGMQKDYDQTVLQNKNMGIMQAFNGIAGTVTGAGSGAFAGPGGMLAGAGSGAVSALTGGLQVGMQQNMNSDALAIRQDTDYFNRDTNKTFADFATRGDYQASIAAQNARVQDVQMVPATMVGQVGGDLLSLMYSDVRINLRWKLIDEAAIQRIGDYWSMYGYAMNVAMRMPDNLLLMTKFTYWKVSRLYVKTGRIPQSYLRAIVGMFEKGITLWRNPADIGTTLAHDNEPVPGFRLGDHI